MESINDLDPILEEVLESRGELRLPARGFSMGARYRMAGALSLRRADRIRIGTVLVYRRDGLWVAHRVIWVFPSHDARLCLTKGDAVMAPDFPAVMKGEEIAVVAGIRTGSDVMDLTTPWRRACETGKGLAGLVLAAMHQGARRALGRSPPPGHPA